MLSIFYSILMCRFCREDPCKMQIEPNLDALQEEQVGSPGGWRWAGGTGSCSSQIASRNDGTLLDLLGSKGTQMPVRVSSSFRNLARKRSNYVTEKDAQEKLQKPPGRRQPVQDYLKMFCPWRGWMREGRRQRRKIVSYCNFQSSDLRRQERGKAEVQFSGYSVSER